MALMVEFIGKAVSFFSTTMNILGGLVLRLLPPRCIDLTHVGTPLPFMVVTAQTPMALLLTTGATITQLMEPEGVPTRFTLMGIHGRCVHCLLRKYAQFPHVKLSRVITSLILCRAIFSSVIPSDFLGLSNTSFIGMATFR